MRQVGNARWLALALVGVLGLGFAALATGKAKKKTKTFSSGDIDFVLPAEESGAVQLDIRKKRSKVKDVNVGLRITSEHAEDLELALTAPNGSQALLKPGATGHTEQYGTGAESCGGEFLVFDDEADAEYPGDNATDGPETGTFRPEQPLSALNRSKLKGVWSLDLEDVDTEPSTIHCVELEIKYKKKLKKKN